MQAAPAATLETELSLGIESDSAVRLESLDALDTEDPQYTPMSDTGFMGDLGWRYSVTDALELNGSIGTLRYQDDSANDTDTLAVGLFYETRLGQLDAAVDLNHTDMTLDGDAFLTLQSIAPSLSYFTEGGLFLLATANFSDKKIKINSAFDATKRDFSLQGFYFFNGFQSYVAFNGAIGAENARDNDFDYDETRLSATLKHPLMVGPSGSKLNLLLEHRERDYPKVATATRKNYETRTRVRLYADVVITTQATLRASYDAKARDTDQSTSDYDSEVLGLRLTYRFGE